LVFFIRRVWIVRMRITQNNRESH